MTTALLVTVVILMAGAFALLDAVLFLAPYRAWLWQTHGTVFLAWASLLACNLFGLLFLLVRVVGLRDTGRKLAHIDRELRQGSPIARELADRLEDV